MIFGAACAGMESPESDDSEFDEFRVIHRDVFDLFSINALIKIAYETKVTLGKIKRNWL